MADVTISNVREVDDHKEYLVLWGDERGEVWTHEKEAKEVCPKVSHDEARSAAMTSRSPFFYLALPSYDYYLNIYL